MATEKIFVIHLWQPWADLVAMGAKTIETRTWHTKHRGPVLICATKALTKDQRVAIQTYQSDMWEGGPLLPADYEPRLGVAVCVANLKTSRELTPNDRRQAAYADHWSIEYWHKRKGWLPKTAWVLGDVQPIEPFELAGRQRPSYMDVDQALLAPALLLDLPRANPATTEPGTRQISLF